MKLKLTKEEIFLISNGTVTVAEMAEMKGLLLDTVYKEIRGYAPRRVNQEVRMQLRQDLLLAESIKLVLDSWGFKSVRGACRVAGIRSLRSWRNFDPVWAKLLRKEGLTLRGHTLKGKQSVRLTAEEALELKQSPRYWLRENGDVVRRCNTPLEKLKLEKLKSHYRVVTKYQQASRAVKLLIEGFTTKQIVEQGVDVGYVTRCRRALKEFKDWEKEIFTDSELEVLRELKYYGTEG